MLVATNKLFDDHARAFFDRDRIGFVDFVLRCQIGKDAAAVIAVAWLDHDGQTELLSGLPGVLSTVDFTADRDWDTAGLKQAFGEIFVAGDGLCDRASIIGFGSPDAALIDAVPKL